MKKIAFLILILCATRLHAQSNPLDSSYFTAIGIDETCSHYPTNVWVTDGMQKLQQTVDHMPGCGNAATNVKWALPYAAKNEWTEFQIHEQAVGGGPTTLNGVTISDLVKTTGPGCSGGSCPGTPTIHSNNINIIVYREGYYDVVHVPESSSLDATGFIPDVLIPAVDPYHGQVTTAFPFTIAANQTQGVWIDILVPSSTPSGYYHGTATVTNGGSAYATLPIVLAVWNFTIPSKPTLINYYGLDTLDMCGGYFGGSDNGYSECHNYPGSTGDDDALRLADLDLSYLLADHRLSAGGAIWPENNGCGSSCVWTQFNTDYGPLLDGTSPHTLLPGAAETMVSLSTPADNASAQSIATEFKVNHNWPQIVSYQCDEPGNNATLWAICASQAAIVDSSTPIIPKLITASNHYATFGTGSLSYMNWMIVQEVDMNNANCHSALDACYGDNEYGNQRNCISSANPAGCAATTSYNQWLGGSAGGFSIQWGPYLGMYIGCSNQGVCGNSNTNNTTILPAAAVYPALSIEVSSVRNRIDPWMDYFHTLKGHLYYDVAWCWAPTNAATGSSSPCWDENSNPPATNTADPWNNIYAFGNNGDGTLVYPGTYAKIGTGASGSWIPVPLPSMRLKLMRDGFQDYEYMNELANQCDSSYVNSQLGFITNIYTYPTDTSLVTARNNMGNQLHTLAGAGCGGGPASFKQSKVQRMNGEGKASASDVQ